MADTIEGTLSPEDAFCISFLFLLVYYYTRGKSKE